MERIGILRIGVDERAICCGGLAEAAGAVMFLGDLEGVGGHGVTGHYGARAAGNKTFARVTGRSRKRQDCAHLPLLRPHFNSHSSGRASLPIENTDKSVCRNVASATSHNSDFHDLVWRWQFVLPPRHR
jgi:hypothetical protein